MSLRVSRWYRSKYFHLIACRMKVSDLNFKQAADSHLLQGAHLVYSLLACMTCLYEAGGTTAENILYEDISVVIDGGYLEF